MSRSIRKDVQTAAARFDRETPAVALLGPHQLGKTTLARAIAERHPGALLMDLERESDRAALQQAKLFFAAHRDRLLIFDEVQLSPNLFAALRPEIDADRHAGAFPVAGLGLGRLAAAVGRITGGPGLVPRTHAAARRRTARHRPGRSSVALAGRRVFLESPGHRRRCVIHLAPGLHPHVLIDTMMVRHLPPHLVNVGKRLVKSPKVYLRDSGVMHALLGIASVQHLQGHSIAGASWEGFVVEQVAAALPPEAQLSFYRTAAGADLDLVIEHGTRKLGVDIEFSSAPKSTKGFWQALQDRQIDRACVIGPVPRRYLLAEGVKVIPLGEVTATLATALRS